jgi:hypothetical protein
MAATRSLACIQGTFAKRSRVGPSCGYSRGSTTENPPADSATYIGKNDQASYRRCGDALFGYWLEQIGMDF